MAFCRWLQECQAPANKEHLACSRVLEVQLLLHGLKNGLADITSITALLDWRCRLIPDQVRLIQATAAQEC